MQIWLADFNEKFFSILDSFDFDKSDSNRVITFLNHLQIKDSPSSGLQIDI